MSGPLHALERADIVELIAALLYLAYARNLGDADPILYDAQMRFVDALDEEDG